MSDQYHFHRYNEVAVFTHRHSGDDVEHDHHSYVWDSNRTFTKDEQGRPTPNEATPLDDLGATTLSYASRMTAAD